MAFYDVIYLGHAQVVHVLEWVVSGGFEADWTIRVDALTAVMLVVVTGVSSLVHLYSIGYMHEDDSRPRFFAYLSFFTFAMLALVTSEQFPANCSSTRKGVGLTSYLLIGFWYARPSANAAAIESLRRQSRSAISALRSTFSASTPIFHTAIDFDAVFARQRLRWSGKTLRLCRISCRHPDHTVPAAVRGCDGQVRPDRAPHLVAGRHGRSNTRLGADPCGRDGDGRAVPRLSLLAAVMGLRRTHLLS